MSGLTHVSGHSDPGVLYGADGTAAYVSRDNGATWRRLEMKVETRALPCGVRIRAVAFFDSRAGWAVGNCHATFMTSDGGSTWRTIHAGDKSDHPLNRAIFYERDEGIASDTKGGLFYTLNAGKTWHTFYERDCTCVVVAMGRAGTAGAWTVDGSPADAIESYMGWGDEDLSADFRRPLKLLPNQIASGGVLEDGMAWLVSVVGRSYWANLGGDRPSWEEREIAGLVTSERVRHAAFSKDGTGLISGTSGTVLITEDGGKNWSRLNPMQIAEILWVGPGVLLARNGSGEVVRSVDKGVTWTTSERLP